MSILLPATIGCVVLILLLVIEKLRRKAAKPRVSATAIPFKDLSLRRQIAYIAAGLAGYVLAIPGSILVIALLVACSLIVLVEPFGVIGKRDAQDYCQEVPLAALPTIPHLPGFDPNQGSSINSGATPTPAPSCRRAQRPPCPNRPLPEQSARRCRNACPASRIPRIPPCARRSPRLRTTSRKTEAVAQGGQIARPCMRYDSWPLSPCPPATFPATQASSVNSPEKWNPGMDLNASRNALTQFLENGKGQVLGLSGRWGAGKTHLWLSCVTRCPPRRPPCTPPASA